MQNPFELSVNKIKTLGLSLSSQELIYLFMMSIAFLTCKLTRLLALKEPTKGLIVTSKPNTVTIRGTRSNMFRNQNPGLIMTSSRLMMLRRIRVSGSRFSRFSWKKCSILNTSIVFYFCFEFGGIRITNHDKPVLFKIDRIV